MVVRVRHTNEANMYSVATKILVVCAMAAHVMLIGWAASKRRSTSTNGGTT
jgi:hypothetical protein